MKEIDEIKAIALEYGQRRAPSILAKGEGEEAMSIIDAAFDLGTIIWEALKNLCFEIPLFGEFFQHFRSILDKT